MDGRLHVRIGIDDNAHLQPFACPVNPDAPNLINQQQAGTIEFRAEVNAAGFARLS
jgi:hypothetical protein